MFLYDCMLPYLLFRCRLRMTDPNWGCFSLDPVQHRCNSYIDTRVVWWCAWIGARMDHSNQGVAAISFLEYKGTARVPTARILSGSKCAQRPIPIITVISGPDCDSDFLQNFRIGTSTAILTTPSCHHSWWKRATIIIIKVIRGVGGCASGLKKWSRVG